MDLDLLRKLQSMAKVEEDPDFRSKKYVIVKDLVTSVSSEFGALSDNDSSDSVSVAGGSRSQSAPGPYTASESTPVVLKHPDNVIYVASPTSPAPPPGWEEQRYSRLSEAFNCANAMALLGIAGCSIVVYPGLYIVPDLVCDLKVHVLQLPSL